MLPEVEEFLAVKNAADKEWQEWNANSHKDEPRRNWNVEWGTEAYSEYQRAHSKWREKFNADYRAAETIYRGKVRAARAKLRATTKDPMIQWMMDNIEDYWSYIEAVLPILPATREELENLATQHDWCSEFDGFMDQATEAGIVPERNEQYDASELVEWVANEYDVYEREVRREIQSRVNKIVEKALANQRVAKEKAPVSAT